MYDAAGQIERIMSLENGKGLQFLLNESYKIFGNPSLLLNMEYELVACTEHIATDDCLWNELIENGSFSNETIAFFKSEDFHDTVASAKTIALLQSDKLKYDRFYGRILNCDNNTVIDLIMIACYEPFGDDTPLAFEAFREKVSKEISVNNYYRMYGNIYHESIIRKLLDNSIEDRIIYSNHVANLYEGLKANLFVAVADVSQHNSMNSGLDDFRDLCKKTQPEFKYAVYSEYIVIIISTEDTELNVEKDLSELIMLFENDNVYAGISGRFENLFDLQKHYQEAVKALRRGLAANNQHRILL